MERGSSHPLHSDLIPQFSKSDTPIFLDLGRPHGVDLQGRPVCCSFLRRVMSPSPPKFPVPPVVPSKKKVSLFPSLAPVALAPGSTNVEDAVASCRCAWRGLPGGDRIPGDEEEEEEPYLLGDAGEKLAHATYPLPLFPSSPSSRKGQIP